MKQKTNDGNGFTVAEIMAVIVIIGMLCAIVIPYLLEARKFVRITSQIKAEKVVYYEDFEWWMNHLEDQTSFSNLHELIGYPDNEPITITPVEEMPPDPVIEHLKEKVNLKGNEIEKQKAATQYKIWRFEKMVLQKEVEKQLLIDQIKKLKKELKS